MSESYDTLFLFNEIYSIVLFVLIFCAQAFLVMRIKLKRLDLSVIVISVAYLVSFAARIPSDEHATKYIRIVTFIMIAAAMYYFVFEMRRIREKLLSQNLKESLSMMKRTTMLRWVINGLLIFSGLIDLVTMIIFDEMEDDKIQ